jgi:hypothetical protein
MNARQPAWVRRAELTEQDTAVLAPRGGGGVAATGYGRAPASLVAGITVVLPIVAFALLLAGKTLAAAALALVAFLLALMFGPETRQALCFAGNGAREWSSTAARIVELRLERRRSKRRLDGALRELGSATYRDDHEGVRLAEAHAHAAATDLARACDEEARIVERARARVERRKRSRRKSPRVSSRLR